MLKKAGYHLSNINSPADLKKLGIEELEILSKELRHFIIDVISNNPGHLGASLGVVELTIALHYVFNTPVDKIVWDVGHQAYAHKILTGRRERFYTNRKYQGISGFPKMNESVYDAFGTGHSSTSISAALGMAIASGLKGDNSKQHIAVIGDGGMTGGMAFEALNHAGVSKTNLLVILNDNGIAIDENVGGLKEYLTDITTSKAYNKIKDDVWKMMSGMERARRIIQKIQNAIKVTLFRQTNIFEALGFRYFGPIDGHDIPRLVKVLEDLKNISGPKLLHVITTKGKGLKQAEEQQTKYHAPGLFNPDTGDTIEETIKSKFPKYQTVFGETILELAKNDERIVGITPAMASGCSLNIMMDKMQERAFDVGIAEQHAVTFSAGLASQDMIPFCNIYSSFMQRAFDQIIHDVAIQKLPVVFCLDRGGLVGEDGATHHGAFDLAYLRLIPDVVISSPANEEELRNLMYSASLFNKGPFVIRYPRGNGVLEKWRTPFRKIEVGKGRIIRTGVDMAFISIGPINNVIQEVCALLEAHGYNCALYDMRFLKPIDENLLHEICKQFNNVITVEDATIVGGLGTAVIEFVNDNGYSTKVKRIGIPDKFVSHGSLQELHNECGFDVDGIFNIAIKLLRATKKDNFLKIAR